MPGKKLLSAAAIAIAGLIATAGSASAQFETNSLRETHFTFSQPVALPNVTLAPGKYTFRLLNSQVSRNVIQVLNEDGTKLIGTFVTVPAVRGQVSADPEVRFYETAADEPLAIQTWWFRSERTGWEFIYPREQAMQLAKRSTTPVLASMKDQPAGANAQQSAAVNQGNLVRIGPEGQPVPDGSGDRTASTADARPAAAPTQVPTPTTRAAVDRSTASAAADSGDTRVAASRSTSSSTAMAQDDPAPVSRQARAQLPATATNTPLILLVGALALAGGILLHTRRRRFE